MSPAARRGTVLVGLLLALQAAACASAKPSSPPPAAPASVDPPAPSDAPDAPGASGTAAPASQNGGSDVLSERTVALAKQLAASLNESDHSRRVSVLPFTDSEGKPSELGRFLSDKVTSNLGHGEKYALVERAKLNQVMSELKLSSSSMISDETAASLGNMLGSDALVLGTLTDLGDSIDLECRIVEPETGLILGTGEAQFPRTPAVARLWSPRPPEVKLAEARGAPPRQPAAGPGSAPQGGAPAPGGAPGVGAFGPFANLRRAWAQQTGFQLAPLESNVNRRGADYRNFDVMAGGARACQRACAEDKTCKAFTFVRPRGGGAVLGHCWLKSEAPVPNSDPACISGVKTEALVEALSPVITNRDQKFFANPGLDGHPLAYCAAKKRDCGIGAATQWCRRMGYQRALHYTASADVGGGNPVMRVGDGQLCRGKKCDRISSVLCAR